MRLFWLVSWRILMTGGLLLQGGIVVASDRVLSLYDQAQVAISAEQPDKAIAYLLKLVEIDPNHAGAWLDLAILFCQQGEDHRAKLLLNVILQKFPLPPAIHEIVNRYRTQRCAPAAANLQWATSLQTGYESNVNQGSTESVFQLGTGPNTIELELTDEAKRHGDLFTGLESNISWRPPDSYNRFAGQLLLRNYQRMEEYDLAALSASYIHPWTLGNWHHQLSGTAATTLLGGQTYQYAAGFQWQGDNKATQLPLQLSASLVEYKYPTNHSFDSTIGKFNISSYFGGQKNWHSQISIGGLLDYSNGERAGGNRTGVWLKASGVRKLAPPWTIDGSIELNSTHSEKHYMPGLLDIPRETRRAALQAGVNREIDGRQYLRLELNITHTNDNIPLFSFTNATLMLSWNLYGSR